MNDKTTLNMHQTSTPWFETVGNRVYQGFWSYFNRIYWLRGITNEFDRNRNHKPSEKL